LRIGGAVAAEYAMGAFLGGGRGSEAEEEEALTAAEIGEAEAGSDPAHPAHTPKAPKKPLGFAAYVGEGVKRDFAKLGTRAAQGATLGSMFGLPGAAIGGGLGVGGGAVENLYDNVTGKTGREIRGETEAKRGAKAQPQTAESEARDAQLQALNRIAGILESIDKKESPIPYREVSRADQIRALARTL
jgi:hypothetical protein